MTRYFLRLRSARVSGRVELTSASLVVAKALASEWARSLDLKTWNVTIENEQGKLEKSIEQVAAIITKNLGATE